MTEKLSYDKAYEELQEIVSDMEDGEIGVDELSIKSKKGCRANKTM